MPPTETQVKTSLALGIEYLSRLSRRIRRPDGTLQLPPETDLVVSHDSPGVALTRIVPKNNGQVRGGPETNSTTGIALPVLKMKGHPSDDFDYIIVGVPEHGGVTNIVTSGPTLNDDTWIFEQTGDYTFKYLVTPPPSSGSTPPFVPYLAVDSSWSVKYKSTWSESGAFSPRYQIAVKKLSGRVLGGVLAWDNFAVVPETTQSYTVVVDQAGEQPEYRSATSFHTTRYHKNLSMANRHLALYSGNPVIQKQLPYLDNFWRQFSDVEGQEAAETVNRIVDEDLYDGLWGWGGDRGTPRATQTLDSPSWLKGADTFYDPDLYSKLFPLDVARAPYLSHAAGSAGNLAYRNLAWSKSPQLRIHTALHHLWARADTETARNWLKTVIWDQTGIKKTGRPAVPGLPVAPEIPGIPGRGGITNDAYKGNWLAVWLCAVTVLEAYLQRVGDLNNRLAEVQGWADQAADSVIKAQVPASGMFQDHTLGVSNARNYVPVDREIARNYRPLRQVIDHPVRRIGDHCCRSDRRSSNGVQGGVESGDSRSGAALAVRHQPARYINRYGAVASDSAQVHRGGRGGGAGPGRSCSE